MDNGQILYPCYFDAGLTRDQGRRVSREKAVPGPTMADIERALHSCRITFSREAKSHPAYWSKREGRLIVTFTGKKTELISHVTAALQKTK